MRAAGLYTCRASHGFQELQGFVILNRAPLALFPIPNTRRESFTLNITGQRNKKAALQTGPGASDWTLMGR
jgi:hypothetical protein